MRMVEALKKIRIDNEAAIEKKQVSKKFLKFEECGATVILSAKEASAIAEGESDICSEYNIDRSELFGYIMGVASNGGREIEFPRALRHESLLAELVRLGYEVQLIGIDLHIRW